LVRDRSGPKPMGTVPDQDISGTFLVILQSFISPTLNTINKFFDAVYAPYKTQEKNKIKRIKLKEEILSWKTWKREAIVWTDEKIFALYPQSRKLIVKIQEDEDPK